MADLRLLIEVLTKGQGDLKNLNRDLKTAGTEAEKTSSQLGNMGKAIGAFATGFVAFKALDFLGDATQAAAEFNDTVSASGVILGQEALPGLEEWADGAAKAFGASKQQALEGANTFAVFGKSAGLAGDDLTEFSTDLTELAGDLASFRGGTTEDAITAIGAALRGESEPIRRYGVLLDDATLRQRALKLGIIDTVKDALTPQQKTLAAQAEIFAQTTDAQGDFARTSEDMANTQRTLGAELENVTIEIGQKLIPVMLELATFTKDNVVPGIRLFLDALGEIGDGVDLVADDFGSLRGDVLTELFHPPDVEDAAITWAESWSKIQESAFDGTLDVAGAIEDGTEIVEGEMEELADAVSPGTLAESIRAGIGDYNNALEELAEATVTNINDLESRAQIEASLASQTLTDALNSDSTRTRTQALELVNDLVADYELIAPGALGAGELVNPAMAEGLRANLGLVDDAAIGIGAAVEGPLVDINAYPWGYQVGAEIAQGMWDSQNLISDAAYGLANTVARTVRIESEPPDPNSPLHGITKWGANIARTLAEGMSGAVSLVSTASRGLASAIAPGTLEGFSVAPGAIPDGTQSVGAGGIHIHLYNMGDPITEDDDVLESLRLLVPHIRDAALSHG